jgi:putative methionine-R-sulfoxide reductase with GAF domain
VHERERHSLESFDAAIFAGPRTECSHGKYGRKPLRRFATVLTHTDTRQAKAERAAAIICRVGSYRWVGLYDVGPVEISVIGWHGPSPPTHPRFPRSQGLNGAAAASGTAVIVQDVSTDTRYLPTIGGTQAEMIVPVKASDGRVVGTIDVESERANAFTEADRALLEECGKVLEPLWA